MLPVVNLTPGDVVQLQGVTGTVERIVHYGGAFDVRIALRDADGKLHWQGANYCDTLKRAVMRRARRKHKPATIAPPTPR